MYTPKEVAENYLSACRTKAALPLGRMFLLACLAGAFVALAGVASTAAAATVGDPSLAKLISGCVFPAGLAMVIVAGSELFTGNNLMIMGVLARTITVRQMLRNWLVVYLGNFAGAVLVAALCVSGHVFSAFGGKLAASVIAIAQTKAGLTFGDAFVRGILCNFLVCIAVWMANAARTVGGKIAAVFFPIMAFVVAGFEHSIANMYYLAAGLFAAGLFAAGLFTAGQTGAAAEGLTWSRALIGNLLPVTLGNLVGGGLLVGVSAWYLYLKQERNSVNS